MKVSFALAALLVCALPVAAQGQVWRGISDAKKAKQILDFYKDSVSHPQQVLQAAQDIKALYINTRNYHSLNNKLVQDAGLFSPGPLALDFVEFAPETTGARSAQFSITLRRVKKEQCIRLSSHAINMSFDSVLINGVPYEGEIDCLGQFPFFRGKNVIKYVAH